MMSFDTLLPCLNHPKGIRQKPCFVVILDKVNFCKVFELGNHEKSLKET